MNKKNCCEEKENEKTKDITKHQCENTETKNSGEYVGYCSKVSESDIYNAVTKDNAKTIEDVIEITGAMKKPNCKENNPKGVCCYQDIAAIVKRLIKKQDV